MINTQTNEKSKEYLMLETFLQKKENNSIELIYSYDDVLTNEQIINIINNKLEVVENELFVFENKSRFASISLVSTTFLFSTKSHNTSFCSSSNVNLVNEVLTFLT